MRTGTHPNISAEGLHFSAFRFREKFETVQQLKDHILKELKGQLPRRPVMDIG